jgi:S1-C subfamily serine protease
MAPVRFPGFISHPVRLTRSWRFYRLMLCVVVLLTWPLFGQGKYSEIGKRVSRAVVKLESSDSDNQAFGLGSGFLVNSNGLIVTNYHVIRDAYHVKATCANGDVYQVEGVVDFDEDKDFAILKITAFNLPVVELGNSDQVEILEEVIAIGHPLGLAYTSSTGVISQWRQKEGFRMLQTTTPISPGNSGGPLVNLRGQVIGIVTEQMTKGQNLNFALPINYVRASLVSNTRVQYGLRQIAEAQAKADEKEKEEMLARLFTVYQDKYKAYNAVVPKAWKLSNSEHWTRDNQTYVITTMVAPEGAARAELEGYLSEGIRIVTRMPQKGKVWTLGTSSEYAAAASRDVVRNNPGFVQTSERDGKVGREPIKILEFVGQNANIEEPEKDRFYILAKPECNITVECVSPAGKFNEEEILFKVFMKTFEFKGCPTWNK